VTLMFDLRPEMSCSTFILALSVPMLVLGGLETVTLECSGSPIGRS